MPWHNDRGLKQPDTIAMKYVNLWQNMDSNICSFHYSVIQTAPKINMPKAVRGNIIVGNEIWTNRLKNIFIQAKK